MKEYNFEYSNQKYATKLFLICFGIGFGLFFGIFGLSKIVKLSGTYFLLVYIMFIIGIPFLIFWRNRKNIKKIGSAKLDENKVQFIYENNIKEIDFSNIQNYLVQTYNGTLLQMKLLNGEKFKMFSNSNYCNTLEFDKFSYDLEIKLENFKKLNNTSIIRKKSFFERVWIYPFLIIMTIFVAIIVFYGFYVGKGFSLKLITVIFPLISLWAGYYSAKNRNK